MILSMWPALAQERVVHVGQPVAVVVAETQAQAADAAELVTVDYEETPAVVDVGKPPRVNAAAAAGVTVIDCEPLGRPLKKSVTVSDCAPAVLNVALNVWLPASVAVNV